MRGNYHEKSQGKTPLAIAKRESHTPNSELRTLNSELRTQVTLENMSL